MHSKLAGLNLPLQDMIANVIESSRAKVAAAEEKEKEEKKSPFGKKEEKKESKEEEKKEKSSSVINFQDGEEVEKLASALDYMADLLIKEADSIDNGGEKKGGGMQLATQSPTGGKQTYTGNKAKHQIPAPTTKATVDNPGTSNAMATDDHRAPGGNGAKYPAKGVLKTAGQSVVAKIEQAKEKQAFSTTEEGHKLDAKTYRSVAKGYAGIRGEVGKARNEYAKAAPKRAFWLHGRMSDGNDDMDTRALRNAERHMSYAAKKHEEGKNAYNPWGGLLTKSPHEKKEKKSAVEAVDFILDKLAEAKGGGMTLDSASGQGPKPPSNPGRQLISSNSAPASATKREAKSPRIGELKQVLTEPAMTSSTDNTVQQNLRNASKGGVKIAAVKAVLSKIASDPSDPRYGALMEAAKQKQASKSKKGTLGGMGSPASSGPSLPATTPGM